jgi:hypothetical protein
MARRKNTQGEAETVEQVETVESTAAEMVAPATLPPIGQIVVPEALKTKSGRIRWYAALGYGRSEIAKEVGVIYQHVRNVLLQEPKRAVREEMPALDIVMKTQDITDQDLADIGLDAVLEADLEASAKADRELVQD